MMQSEISINGFVGEVAANTFKHQIIVSFGQIEPLRLTSENDFKDREECRKDLCLKMKYMSEEVEKLMTMPLVDLHREYRQTAPHLH